MTRNALITILVVIAVLILGGVVLANRNDDEPTPADTASTAADDTAPEQTPAEESAAGDSVQTSEETVKIDNSGYTPENITIKKGTTVVWTNEGSDEHTVTPNNPTDEFKASELLANGESYRVTFNTPGTYEYFCEPHPFMTGTVVVTE